MPNWCNNMVELHHKDQKKLNNLIKELSKGNDEAQIFNILRKRPKKEEKNWYDWNCSNWGVKWDANIIDWEERDECIWISFDTAWGAPIQLYEYLHDKGWTVEAYYHEPGMRFCGSFINGEEDYYEYADILEDYDELQKIPEEIYEFANLEYEHENHMEYLKEERENEE